MASKKTKAIAVKNSILYFLKYLLYIPILFSFSLLIKIIIPSVTSYSSYSGLLQIQKLRNQFRISSSGLSEQKISIE